MRKRKTRPTIYIIEEGGQGKKYFTMIPNYIIDISTSDELALYVHVKRRTGDKGNYYSTQQTTAFEMGWGKGRVRKNIKGLLDKNLIEKIGTKPSRTHPINIYRPVDIWRKNKEFYESGDYKRLISISACKGKGSKSIIRKVLKQSLEE